MHSSPGGNPQNAQDINGEDNQDAMLSVVALDAPSTQHVLLACEHDRAVMSYGSVGSCAVLTVERVLEGGCYGGEPRASSLGLSLSQK